MRAAVAIKTNATWLNDLEHPGREGPALEELRVYLRGVLGRVLGGRGNVDEYDLDDFTQEALVRILNGLGSFRGNSRFTTWASAVAIRVALSALRRRRYKHCPLEDIECGFAGAAPASYSIVEDPGDAIDRSTLLAALQRAIRDSLTERQRAVVQGKLAGISGDVLAERLHTNPNALYKLYHDARQRLRRALNEAGFSDDEVREQFQQAS